jgi:hypothetical protein
MSTHFDPAEFAHQAQHRATIYEVEMRRFAIVAIALSVIGCGASSPTAPTPAIPMLTGQWLGSYTITACTENGAAAGFCASVGRGGTHSYTPTQAGSNLSGTLGIGTFTLPVTGNVGTDNVVVLSGSGQIVQGATLTLNTWRAVVSGSSMTGTMVFTIASDPPNIGLATVTATTGLAR